MKTGVPFGLTICQPKRQDSLDTIHRAQLFQCSLIHLTQMMLIRAECYGELEMNKEQAAADIMPHPKPCAGITSEVYMLDAGTASYLDIVKAARHEYRKRDIGHGAVGGATSAKRSHGRGHHHPRSCMGLSRHGLPVLRVRRNVAGFAFNEVGGCN